VQNFEAWNEENLWVYLTPQYDGNRLVAGDQYRRMLNAFYNGIHSVDKHAHVLIGGNAPYGDPPGGRRSRPLVFLRDLFCLTSHLDPKSCPHPAKFDVLGTHPINLSGGPTQSAVDPDDVSSADLPNVVRVLRAAENAHTIAGKRHDVWVTEFWWQSYPDNPDPNGLSLAKHGTYIEQALYLFWTAGASVAINYEVCDSQDDDPQTGDDLLQTGLFLNDCSPKPAATSFRFPFVLDRRSKSQVFIWGKSPQGGKLAIQRKSGGAWRKITGLTVKRDHVFTSTLHAKGQGKYRATIGANTSLVWSLRR
jgi:hypothetical protein